MWYIKDCTTPSHVCADNAFEDDHINSILELAHQYDETDSEIIDVDGKPKYSTNVRNAKIIGLTVDDNTSWLYKNISYLIEEINKTHYQYDIDHFDALMIVRYEGKDKGHYVKHLDASYDVNEKSAMRKLSFVMQLTDSNEYEGGDLILYPGAYHERSKIVIPRKKGTIVIFPSRIAHEVTPVTNGVRHSLVTWIYGPKFR